MLRVPQVQRKRDAESPSNSILSGEVGWREGARWVILLLLTYFPCLVPHTAGQLRELYPKSLVRRDCAEKGLVWRRRRWNTPPCWVRLWIKAVGQVQSRVFPRFQSTADPTGYPSSMPGIFAWLFIKQGERKRVLHTCSTVNPGGIPKWEPWVFLPTQKSTPNYCTSRPRAALGTRSEEGGTWGKKSSVKQQK